jgi:hypothetical protein
MIAEPVPLFDHSNGIKSKNKKEVSRQPFLVETAAFGSTRNFFEASTEANDAI